MGKPNFFVESTPLTGFNWVQDNATVRTETQAQVDFLNSDMGIKLMDRLFDAQTPAEYQTTASLLESHLQYYANTAYSPR